MPSGRGATLSPVDMGRARWAPLSGIAFAALWIAAAVLILVEDAGNSNDEILSYYADEANRGQAVTAAFLILLAVLSFCGSCSERLSLRCSS